MFSQMMSQKICCRGGVVFSALMLRSSVGSHRFRPASAAVAGTQTERQLGFDLDPQSSKTRLAQLTSKLACGRNSPGSVPVILYSGAHGTLSADSFRVVPYMSAPKGRERVGQGQVAHHAPGYCPVSFSPQAAPDPGCSAAALLRHLLFSPHFHMSDFRACLGVG